MDKNRARDACTKGLEGLTTTSWDRNKNLGGERDTRSAQAVLSEVLRLICVLRVERERSHDGLIVCFHTYGDGPLYLFLPLFSLFLSFMNFGHH